MQTRASKPTRMMSLAVATALAVACAQELGDPGDDEDLGSAAVVTGTRLYLGAAAAPSAAPAPDAVWDITSGADTKLLSRARDGSAFATKTCTETSSTRGDCLVRRYLSEPLAAQTISGTVKGRIRARESASNADVRTQLVVKVVSGDGATVRGVLYAAPASGTSLTHELNATTLQARSLPFDGPAALTSVAALAGDRLLVEVGVRYYNTSSTSFTGTLELGAPTSATDLPEDETTTTQGAPWIELSQALVWRSGGGRFDIGAHEFGASAVTPTIPDFPHGGGQTIWISGSGSGTSCTQTAPCSLTTGEGRAGPGDTLMFTPGTHRICSYRPKVSGSSTGYLVWSAPALGDVTIAPTAGCGSSLFQMTSAFEATGWSTGVHYVAWTNLVFDGREPDGSQTSGSMVRLRKYSHHFLVLNNVFRYGGANGVSCRSCDYVRYIGNSFYRMGHVDGNGWASAMNLHAADGHPILDAYAGFHNIIARNFVSGSFDPYGDGNRNPDLPHTDGNGAIYDCPGGTYPGGYVDVPRTLWLDNVSWQNGGDGLRDLQANDQWYINNTVVGNGLDPDTGSPPAGLGMRSARRVYWLNNLSWAPSGRYTFAQRSMSIGSVGDVTEAGNLAFGGGFSGVPESGDATKFLVANPSLVGPQLGFAADGQLSAVEPWNLGDRLKLTAGSAAVDGGIDPRTYMNAAQVADFEAYGLLDAYGGVRPR